jgi:hypothetical protein
MGGMLYESVLVVLATGDTGESALERDALDALNETSVTWSRLEREGRVACLAARVRHADPPTEFRHRVRQWSSARGWGVTVAPCGPNC